MKKPKGVSKLAAVRDALAHLGSTARATEIRDFVARKFSIDISTAIAGTYKSILGQRSKAGKASEVAETPEAPEPVAAKKSDSRPGGRDVLSAWHGIVDKIGELASRDEEFRGHLREVMLAILNLAGPASQPESPSPASPTVEAPATPAPAPAVEAVAESAPVEEVASPAAAEVSPVASEPVPAAEPTAAAAPANGEERPRREPLPPLTFAGPPPEEPRDETAGKRKIFPPTPQQIPLIETRFRLKAEAARWALERHGLLKQGAAFKWQIDPRDRDLISRARDLPDCHLWMLNPATPAPRHYGALTDIAGCFDAAAEGATLVAKVVANPRQIPDFLADSLLVLAEAHAALRWAILGAYDYTDPDQLLIHLWLKQLAEEHRIFIPRFMQSKEQVDPGSWQGIGERRLEIDKNFEEARTRERTTRKLFGKAEYLQRTILTCKGDQAKYDDSWKRFLEIITEMVDAGVPPSNREIRELLVPLTEQLPDAEFSKNVRLVLREIDTYLANRDLQEEEEAKVVPSSAEVRQVASLLKGRSMVLIGGVPRPFAQRMLKKQFQLKELIWIDTQPHQSYTDFEPDVADKDVAVVLLAIRWSSHSYGEVQHFCAEYGKPLVRLPRGYNANQVAAEILSQCSGKLEQLARSHQVV